MTTSKRVVLVVALGALLLPEVALAQAASGGQSPALYLIPYLAIFAIFYFLLLRPQQQKAKQHDAMLNALAKGDEVITAGGIHGKIHGLTHQLVTLEVSENPTIRIKVSRSRVEGKAHDTKTEAAKT